MSHCGAIGSRPMANAALRKPGALLIWVEEKMAWLAPHEGRPPVFPDTAKCKYHPLGECCSQFSGIVFSNNI